MSIPISEELQTLTPYKPGTRIDEIKREVGLDRVVKLASNENPLGLSPQVIQTLKKSLSLGFRYPDASAYKLKQAFSSRYSVEVEKIAVGNGSNDLIDLLIRAFCDPRKPSQSVLTSEKAFMAYEICAKAARVKVIKAPMTSDYRFDLKSLKELACSQKPRLIFIANPNNPTGTYVSHQELDTFLEEVAPLKETLVVLDEAYCEYVTARDFPKSFELQKKHPHLVVLRTMSKVFSLAGFRVGALFAEAFVVDVLNRIRLPFNVNFLAQEVAAVALSDKEHVERSFQLNSEGLNYLYSELSRLKIKYWPSQANFILFQLSEPAQQVYERLLKEGVIVRPVANYDLENCLRVSVGLPEDNRFFIKCLEKVLLWEE